MIKRSTWILLAFLALFIGAYYYLKAHPLQLSTSTPMPTATESSFLISKEEATLTSVLIADSQGNTFQMNRDSAGVWAITKPKSTAADQSKAEAAETQLFALKVVTTLDTTPSLDVIGLNPSAYTISIELSDNKKMVLEVGSLTPTNSGYYLRYASKVYVVSKNSMDPIIELLQNPPYLATPTPVPFMVATATTTMTSISATATP